MNKTAIITLAGTSTRFGKSVGFECHKSLYHPQESEWTILGHHLQLLERFGFTDIILIGGYCYEDVQAYVRRYYPHLPVRLFYNPHFVDYGSGYSLVLGIEQVRPDCGELVFLEGDLIFDTAGFGQLMRTPGDAVTATCTLVDAHTSVAFYISATGRLRYVYDPAHKQLVIPEPFTKVGNSGQVWKFASPQRLKRVIALYGEQQYKGTNLLPIMDYYENVDCNRVPVITFSEWFNCNTEADYSLMRTYIENC